MKIYIVKQTRHRMDSTDETFVSGSVERLAKYAGIRATADRFGRVKPLTIRSVLKQWQKDLDWRYGCTYTSASVELVDKMPGGVRVHQLEEAQ